MFERSADDFFNSDLILFWGGNPIYTQIPQAHFYIEASNGTKIVWIAPDYNPSRPSPISGFPIKPGTDAALALAVCREIIEGGHVNEAFVKEQTDLPLLVRQDTFLFLKQSDLEEGGREDHHVMWDAKTNALAIAPFRTLSLGEINPVLEVDTKVRLRKGRKVHVRSVFSMLRERLAPYTPEAASEMCGVSPAMIRRLAAMIVKAKAMTSIGQTSMCKYFHGNLAERSVALVFSLTGNMGRKGAGFGGFPLLTRMAAIASRCRHKSESGAAIFRRAAADHGKAHR